jgi:hypothetical protein
MINEKIFEDIIEKIKISKIPLLLLLIVIIKKELLDDESLSYIIRIFMKYHFNIFLNFNCEKIINRLNDYNLTINTIKDFYSNLKKQIYLLEKIKDFRKGFNKHFFWNLNIDNQISYLEKLRIKLNSINDCCNSNMFFHSRIKLSIINDNVNFFEINTYEIFNRLKLIYKTFGYKFFSNNKINIITYEDYNDMSYINKCNYFEYIYFKILAKLNNIIDIFILYNCCKTNLNNLVNPKIVNIEPSIFNSDIELDF